MQFTHILLKYTKIVNNVKGSMTTVGKTLHMRSTLDLSSSPAAANIVFTSLAKSQKTPSCVDAFGQMPP